MNEARPATAEPSLADLVKQLSEQSSQLIRDELRLAKAEMTEKGKRAGLGAGLFGGAGIFAAFGFGAFVAAAILALAIALSAWLAALLVGVALFLGAGMSALLGKREVKQAAPAVPPDVVDGIKQDVHAFKPRPNGGRS